MLDGGALAATGSGPVDAAASDSRGRYQKLAAAVITTLSLLLLAAFLYDEQAATYDLAYVPAVLLQMVYETPFQPLFLVIALLPIYVACARNASWVAVIGGGLMMISLALPYSRFLVLDFSPQSGLSPAGFHNTLFQLAGPGNQMPQFVSIVTLLLMGGVVALLWKPQVGGLIGLIGVITMVFVWPAVYDEPPTRSGQPVVVFFSRSLLFGYYLAWAGAVIAIGGEWAGAQARRMRGEHAHGAGSRVVGA